MLDVSRTSGGSKTKYWGGVITIALDARLNNWNASCSLWAWVYYDQSSVLEKDEEDNLEGYCSDQRSDNSRMN